MRSGGARHEYLPACLTFPCLTLPFLPFTLPCFTLHSVAPLSYLTVLCLVCYLALPWLESLTFASPCSYLRLPFVSLPHFYLTFPALNVLPYFTLPCLLPHLTLTYLTVREYFTSPCLTLPSCARVFCLTLPLSLTLPSLASLFYLTLPYCTFPFSLPSLARLFYLTLPYFIFLCSTLTSPYLNFTLPYLTFISYLTFFWLVCLTLFTLASLTFFLLPCLSWRECLPFPYLYFYLTFIGLTFPPYSPWFHCLNLTLPFTFLPISYTFFTLPMLTYLTLPSLPIIIYLDLPSLN